TNPTDNLLSNAILLYPAMGACCLGAPDIGSAWSAATRQLLATNPTDNLLSNAILLYPAMGACCLGAPDIGSAWS
ncbi:hypothetical protein Q2T48_33965, partial [Pseudomonas aeruginosa]|uniref:hypothetical protein n=1 Tax=Pseudomonas aeruginosa TaxID=287 RepID=UPI00265D9DBC